MTYRTGFHDGRLGIGLEIATGMGDGTGKPRYPLDINGDIRLTGAIVDSNGDPIQMMAQQRTFPNVISDENITIGDGTVFGAGTFKLNGLKTYYNEGNVGIGTTNPDYKLEVNGTTYISGNLLLGTTSNSGYQLSALSISCTNNLLVSGTITGNLTGNAATATTATTVTQAAQPNITSVGTLTQLSVTGDIYAGQYIIHAYNTNTYIGFPQNDQFKIVCNNSETLRILANGNVGIGTTSPDELLHIHGGNTGGTAFNDTVLLLSGTSTVNFGMVGMKFNMRAYASGAKSAIFSKDYAGTWNRSSLVFCTNNDSNSNDATLSDARMVIRETGNVGIGTPSPGYKLSLGTSLGVLAIYENGGNYLYGLGAKNVGNGWGLNFYASTGNNADGNIRMCIKRDTGNIGIGTPAPQSKLDITGDGTNCLCLRNGSGSTVYTKSQILFSYNGNPYNSSGYTHKIQSRHNSGSPHHRNAIDFYLWKGGQGLGDIGNTHGMSITAGGVGIGTTSPVCPLDVIGVSDGYYMSYVSFFTKNNYQLGNYYLNSDNYGITIRAEESIVIGKYYWSTSDERIKENIVDVPDTLALQMVRDIPCRYYEYKDKLNRGTEKTIGFIAQEVKAVLPMAVSLQTEIIPNEMRILENVSWEADTSVTNENATFKLTTDLVDVSGVKYRFYVSNSTGDDGMINDEVRKEIVGNEDNTFTFDNEYANIFCYGKEVDDFHTIDKQKIFALNFSATQEIDRQQQADKAEIAELKTKVSTLESELAMIKTHLGL